MLRQIATGLTIVVLCGCDTGQGIVPSGGTQQPDSSVMIFVPSGEFIMGSPSGQFNADESPQHRVTLSGFYIGACEVTNSQYALFLSDSGGDAHWDYRMEILKSGKRFQAASNRGHYPVTYATQRNAAAYCAWIGGRLPTEAEWEKAARGPSDSRIFPWGDQISSGTQANFNNVYGGLWEVGTATGLSPYGCADMAGNVWEWAADWYDAGYYLHSPTVNPTGPVSGQARVIRGGSFMDDEYAVRCSRRSYLPEDARFVYLGFRCAMDSAAFPGKFDG